VTAATVLSIAHDFRGVLLPEAHHAVVRLGRTDDSLCIDVDAPYFGDPAPAGPAGPTDRLWEHEVCEVFVADDADNYLEVELSPHGHHLVLVLAGVRNVVRSQLPIVYHARIVLAPDAPSAGPMGRFYGQARVPWDYLPVPTVRANAYAIHGPPAQRCYHAHSPPGGESADFHKLASFVSLQLA
jgi:hypothetical protein